MTTLLICVEALIMTDGMCNWLFWLEKVAMLAGFDAKDVTLVKSNSNTIDGLSLINRKQGSFTKYTYCGRNGNMIDLH